MRVKRIVATVVLAIGIFTLVIGCAPELDVSGSWIGFVVFDQGDEFAGMSYTLSLFLIQEGTILSGQVGLGSVLVSFMVPITSGTLNANSLSIQAAGTVTIFSSSGSVTITLEGDCDEAQMSGTGTYTINSAFHSFTWQAQPN